MERHTRRYAALLGFYTDADDAVARVNLRRGARRELTERYNLDLDPEFTRELTADRIVAEDTDSI